MAAPAPTILIRRVWIGDPPTEQMSAQMDHYRSYAPAGALKNWADDSLVHGADGAEAAEALHAVLRDSDADTVNVRIHVKGLHPGQVDEQLDRHRDELLPRLRQLMGGASAPGA